MNYPYICRQKSPQSKRCSLSKLISRLAALCFLLTATATVFANPVVYKQSVPANGSEISSWDITLQFDITDALAAAAVSNPGDAVGIGMSSGKGTTLYKGDVEDNVVLAKSTASLTGRSEGFKVNGNTITLSFDNNIPIIKGQKYTVVIESQFALYISGKSTRISSTILDYYNSGEKLVLTFYGADLSDSQIYAEGCSIAEGSKVKTLSTITYDISGPFDITSGAKVTVTQRITSNSSIKTLGFSSSLTVAEGNDRQLVATFDPPLNLPYNTEITYTTITLPTGAVTLKNHPDVAIKSLAVNCQGDYTETFNVLSVSPKQGEVTLPAFLYLNYDLPEGMIIKIRKTPEKDQCDAMFWEEGEERRQLSGILNADNNGIVWDLSNFNGDKLAIPVAPVLIDWKPSTKYNVLVQARAISALYNSSGQRFSGYANPEVLITWTTPAADAFSFPAITKEQMGANRMGEYTNSDVPRMKEGEAYAYISQLQIRLKDNYEYNGEKYELGAAGQYTIYDVTNGKRTHVKTAKLIKGNAKMADGQAFPVCKLNSIDTHFYVGHDYEIVIPAGTLYLIKDGISYRNYSTNEEIVYRIKGNQPLMTDNIQLQSKSITDGESIAEIGNVSWTFKGNCDVKEGACASFKATASKNIGGITKLFDKNLSLPLTVVKEESSTILIASLHDKYGKTFNFSQSPIDADCTLTLPADILTWEYIPGEILTNAEVTTNFIGVKDPSPRDVSVSINSLHTMSFKAAYGEPLTLTITPDEDWTVSSLTHNGKKQTVTDGIYTSAPLTEPADIKATLDYNKPMNVDMTTGVHFVEGTPVKVYRDTDMIVVEGVDTTDTIAVYNVAGVLIKKIDATEGNDIVRISAEPGNTYIVVVRGQGAKIQL